MLENITYSIVIPGGKKYVIRDDGYRVYAYEDRGPEETIEEDVIFEYKHSTQPDAAAIVKELLIRASMCKGRDQINSESR